MSEYVGNMCHMAARVATYMYAEMMHMFNNYLMRLSVIKELWQRLVLSTTSQGLGECRYHTKIKELFATEYQNENCIFSGIIAVSRICSLANTNWAICNTNFLITEREVFAERNIIQRSFLKMSLWKANKRDVSKLMQIFEGFIIILLCNIKTIPRCLLINNKSKWKISPYSKCT